MKTKYYPDAKAYQEYYLRQTGKGYPVFAGRRYQRGHGLGSIIGNLFKSAVPMLKKGAKAIGKEALRTGLGIASDVMEGQNIKQAAETRVKGAGRNLVQKTIDAVGPPGEKAIKEPVKRKPARRRQTVKQRRPKDIFG